MDLDNLLQRYCHINLLFTDKTSNISNTLRSIILSVVVILLHILQQYVHFSKLNSSLTRNEWAVVGLYMFSETVTCVAALAHITQVRYEIDEIQFKLRNLERFLREKLKYKICFKDFNNEMQSILRYLGALYLVIVIVTLSWPTAKYQSSITAIFLFMKTLRLFNDVEVLFYLTLLKHLILHMNLYINLEYRNKALNLSFSGISGVADILKLFKEMHYRIWSISIQMNQAFGVKLFTIILQTFMDVAYSAYWIFSYVLKVETRRSAIRPSLHLSFAVISITILVNVCDSCAIQVIHDSGRCYI